MPRSQSILVPFRFLFKIPNGYPVLFIWETPPPGKFFRASYRLYAFAFSVDCFTELLGYLHLASAITLNLALDSQLKTAYELEVMLPRNQEVGGGKLNSIV